MITKLWWLEKHGGRDESDLFEDAKGEYVFMRGTYEETVKIYLPKEDILQ